MCVFQRGTTFIPVTAQSANFLSTAIGCARQVVQHTHNAVRSGISIQFNNTRHKSCGSGRLPVNRISTESNGREIICLCVQLPVVPSKPNVQPCTYTKTKESCNSPRLFAIAIHCACTCRSIAKSRSLSDRRPVCHAGLSSNPQAR